MRLTFFLIALFLIMLRICLPALGLWHTGASRGSIVMTGDNYRKELNWSGKFRLSEDERSIAEMNPGGHLKFRDNDTSLEAESNMKGEIHYSLYDGQQELPATNPEAAAFIAAQIRKMIQMGFFSDGRPERILQKGGNKALLAEISHLPIDGAGRPYLDLLLRSDSLGTEERIDLLQEVGVSGNVDQIQGLLDRFQPEQLNDPVVGRAWLAALDRMGEVEEAEKEVLVRYLKNDTVNGTGLSPEMYDSVLAITTRWDDVIQKKDVYECLTSLPGKTGDQWIWLIRAASRLNDDNVKGDLLAKIWAASPKDDNTKTEYISAAKTIEDDFQYGKAMRVIN
jgi:hypothetical protein